MKHTSILLMTSLLAGTPVGPAVQAEPITASTVVGIVSDQLVGDWLSSLRDRVVEVIVQGQESIESILFSGRIQASMLVDDIDRLIEQVGDRTFRQLDEQQRAAVLNLQAVLDRADISRQSALSDARKTMADLWIGLGATVPFAKQMPFVADYGPVALTENDLSNQAEFSVSVRGVWLGHEESELRFGGTSCRRTSSQEPSLTFSCASKDLITSEADSTGTRYIEGSLVIPIHRSWVGHVWAAITGRPTEQRYKTRIAVVPEVFARFEVTAVTEHVEWKSKNRRQFFEYRNGNCAGDKYLTWASEPDKGQNGETIIDTASVRANEVWRSADSSWTLDSVNHRAIVVTAVIRNNGQCIFGGGDAKGGVGVEVLWRDQWPIDVIRRQTVSKGVLTWGEAVSIDLPTNTKSYSVEIAQVDGRSFVFDGTSATKGAATVSLNQAGDQVVIQPTEAGLFAER